MLCVFCSPGVTTLMGAAMADETSTGKQEIAAAKVKVAAMMETDERCRPTLETNVRFFMARS